MKATVNSIAALALSIGMTLPVLADEHPGSPYKTHTVPGIVEAEDFDLGGEGKAYHWRNRTTNCYRKEGVNIQSAKNNTTQQVLVGCSNGDWTNYTIDVKEEGDYEIATLCATANNFVRYELRIDGEAVTPAKKVPNKTADVYTEVVTSGIRLKAGRHTLQFYAYGNMNVDKFILRRTGALSKDKTAKVNYPLTQVYDHNPLFVGFPSPMFESKFQGAMYTADPTARVWNIDGKERLYVYASHDMEPNRGCDRMDRYHVFSTEDMKTWTDHGEIMNSEQVNKKYGHVQEGFMWAPDCMYNPQDKKYYFYFPHAITWRGYHGQKETVWKIFVATSKNPVKDFKLIGSVENALSYIDPCIFKDDDGTVYFYQGGSARLYAGKLQKDDWTKIDGEMIEQKGMEDFHEGAWVFKRNGKYYLSYPDNHSSKLGGNRMRYAMADSPLGPWKSMGVYLNAHGEETTHGSVVEYQGKWYQFYHTANHSGAGALRSVCVDELTFNPDGSINVIRNWGTPRNGILPELSTRKPLKIEAEEFNDGGSHNAWFKRPIEREFEIGVTNEQGIVVKSENGATYLANMERNEWARYSIDIKQGGKYHITVRMRQNGRNDSKFTLAIDGRRIRSGETPLELVADEWGNVQFIDVELPQGEHFIEWRGLNGNIDVDYIFIEKSL